MGRTDLHDAVDAAYQESEYIRTSYVAAKVLAGPGFRTDERVRTLAVDLVEAEARLSLLAERLAVEVGALELALIEEGRP